MLHTRYYRCLLRGVVSTMSSESSFPQNSHRGHSSNSWLAQGNQAPAPSVHQQGGRWEPKISARASGDSVGQRGLQQQLENQSLRHYRLLRRTELTAHGLELERVGQPPDSMRLTVMSYNVLAQDLLEEHSYLYRGVSRDALDWEGRARRLLREFRDSRADILCLQEVQSDQLESFYRPQLHRMGYRGIFKKRTGSKPDGCAIFYRNSKLALRDTISVEYCRPDVQLLDRDNIGLVALLSPRHLKPLDQAPYFCVATTHLLYNPKRHDIKLAQLQLLFAELDRITFNDNGKSTKYPYHPVILTGDFNLTPTDSIYNFVTNGSLQYEGLSRDLTAPDDRPGKSLAKELIPPYLNVTDQCQHLTVVQSRADATGTRDAGTFASGQLSHRLQFSSAYEHTLERLNGAPAVTTRQKDWVTVDYIFYSRSEEGEPSLELVSRLGLLAGSEAEEMGGLPNLATPSDHLPLVATFTWRLPPSSAAGRAP